MDKPGNKNSIENQIEALNQQYENALEKGEEFSILRQIREKLRELKKELQSNGNGSGNSNGHGHQTDHSNEN